MKINEEQLRMLADYYNACDPFLDRKEVYVGVSGIKVVSLSPEYNPDDNQHMPEEVWQPLELWHMRHMIQVSQWLKATDDLPF